MWFCIFILGQFNRALSFYFSWERKVRSPSTIVFLALFLLPFLPFRGRWLPLHLISLVLCAYRDIVSDVSVVWHGRSPHQNLPGHIKVRRRFQHLIHPCWFTEGHFPFARQATYLRCQWSVLQKWCIALVEECQDLRRVLCGMLEGLETMTRMTSMLLARIDFSIHKM